MNAVIQVVCAMCKGRGWVPKEETKGRVTFKWDEKCSSCGGCGFSVLSPGDHSRDLPPYKKRSAWRITND